MKTTLKFLIVLFLSFSIISCSKMNQINKDEEAKEMHYLVKKTKKSFELSNDWDSPHWSNADILELKNFMGKKPEHFPKTQAKVLYDKENIYVIFKVEDQYVRAVAENTHGRVCRDSCVEFFFSPNPDKINNYFNLETNCGGTLLFHYNEIDSKTKVKLDIADCNKIEVLAMMPKIIEPEIAEPTTWTLAYKLPVEILGKYATVIEPKSGVKWPANFYKCADRTSHPHWLTWAPVDYPKPHFHLPEFFGAIEFD